MKRNNLIDRLAVILTRKDNGEQYVVTELGLLFTSNSEQTESQIKDYIKSQKTKPKKGGDKNDN